MANLAAETGKVEKIGLTGFLNRIIITHSKLFYFTQPVYPVRYLSDAGI